MSKVRLHSLILLVFAVAACGGDEVGTSGTNTAFVTLDTKPTPESTPSPAPSPAPAPTPVTNSASSLLPYIDVSKIPAAAAGFSAVRIRAAYPHEAGATPTTDGSGAFRMPCDFSHISFNDPIVAPGKPGGSHLHVFFGNTAIDHASTQSSIENTGNSTCAGGTANRTGYWVPAIIDTKDGTPLKPLQMLVYYKTDAYPNSTVKPKPAGLRMVAGDMKATGPQEHIYWECFKPSGETERSSSIPASCPVGGKVELTVAFPICWDGVNLDSPDHKSHMAYPTKVGCPTSHPVQLPHLTEKVSYAVTETGSTARWRLSSDNYGTDKPGGYSLHADWFNGWDPKVQDTWVKNCLQAKRDCHGFLLGDGTTLY